MDLRQNGYWRRIASQRLVRRRFLADGFLAGAALSVLSLVGCSGDETKHDGARRAPQDKSGLLATYEDTTARATPGGVDKLSIASDTSGFDGLSAVPVPPAIH